MFNQSHGLMLFEAAMIPGYSWDQIKVTENVPLVQVTRTEVQAPSKTSSVE